jgi:hypothetical protein
VRIGEDDTDLGVVDVAHIELTAADVVGVDVRELEEVGIR